MAFEGTRFTGMGQELRSNWRPAVVLLALLLVLWLVLLLPPSLRQSATFLLVIWVILLPLAYFSLGEARSTMPPLLELPRTPVGLHWEHPRGRRDRRESQLSGPDRLAREVMNFLRRNGYSSVGRPEQVSLAESPAGKKVLVKVCTETAGVLACQDTMRDMIRSGVREAIIFAPRGSTRGARRFVRAIRSKRRLRIHIWHQLNQRSVGPATREKA